MLKLVMAQLGIKVDQETVDTMISNVTACIADVRAMKESQDRTETMVRQMYFIDFPPSPAPVEGPKLVGGEA